MTFLDTLPEGVWFTESGVWMFIPKTADSTAVYRAADFLDNIANAKYEAEKAIDPAHQATKPPAAPPSQKQTR